MQPIDRSFNPLKSIPEEKPLYYFHYKLDEEYEKALKAKKQDTEDYQKICEENYSNFPKENK